MRSTIKMILFGTSLVALCAGTASADLSVYYRAGSWDAFSGPGTDGKQVCGIGSTNPVDGRSFSIRFTIGGNAAQFEAKKSTWTIPADTQLPVVLQVGLDTPWNLQAKGDGQVVAWSLDQNAIQAFDVQFRRAGSMTVSFPGGNEAPWTLALNGSTAISNAFGRCVTDWTARVGTQSSGAPTQPFAQPNLQQPTQPVTPR